jgi:hypothetical protein
MEAHVIDFGKLKDSGDCETRDREYRVIASRKLVKCISYQGHAVEACLILSSWYHFSLLDVLVRHRFISSQTPASAPKSVI